MGHYHLGSQALRRDERVGTHLFGNHDSFWKEVALGTPLPLQLGSWDGNLTVDSTALEAGPERAQEDTMQYGSVSNGGVSGS